MKVTCEVKFIDSAWWCPAWIDRRISEGSTFREAVRCLGLREGVHWWIAA
jgi:hypothetical protein